MNRAYAILDIKAMSDDERVIEGIASTPSADRMGDVVEPMGAKFALPMPLLWQHDSRQPIGHVEFAKPTAKGIPFKARLASTDEPGALKERLDEAWQSIKLGLVRAVSIGFRSLEHSYMEGGGVKFHSWEWLELSAVTIPANADASITSIKSIDQELRARIGEAQPDVEGSAERPKAPAVVGKSTQPTKVKAMSKMTIGEQIAAYENTRQSKQVRMDELQDAVIAEGRTKSADEREEYDTLRDEIGGIDAELKDLRDRESSIVARAVVVERANSQKEGSALRSAYGSVTLRQRPEKGIAFTRLLGAKYLAMQHHCAPWDIAKRWKDTPEVEMVLRAAVAPGTTTDTNFAESLVELNNMTGEFIELLRAREILSRLTGLDRVPFNVKVPRGTTDPTAYWVGEGDVKPLSRGAFDSIELTFNKVAGIVPMTQELMMFSNPSAEVLVRDGLVKALAYLTDRDFLDPTKAVSTGVSPASVTNGVTGVAATGTTADALRDDMGNMIAEFAEANEDTTGVVLIMTPQQALRISLMRNSLGQREFPDITMNGGFLEGFPVITSTNIAATGGSPTDGHPIVAVNAPNIYLAEGGVEVDISREASLQMSDSPDSPETASTVLVNLWQRNMVAIKAERFITWKKKHDTSVQLITHAKYA
jgi:HK97 family phage major capsid protein/HK97 family phage prohead protease